MLYKLTSEKLAWDTAVENRIFTSHKFFSLSTLLLFYFITRCRTSAICFCCLQAYLLCCSTVNLNNCDKILRRVPKKMKGCCYSFSINPSSFFSLQRLPFLQQKHKNINIFYEDNETSSVEDCIVKGDYLSLVIIFKRFENKSRWRESFDLKVETFSLLYEHIFLRVTRDYDKLKNEIEKSERLEWNRRKVSNKLYLGCP